MYILAGKKKLEEARNVELPRLQEKAQETNLPVDAQHANDYVNMISRFEKKLHDLDLTRMVSIQMAPQIRMVQSSNTVNLLTQLWLKRFNQLLWTPFHFGSLKWL